MRKVSFLATVWTLILAIPFTALALVGSAFITDHLNDMVDALRLTAVNWGRLAAEGAARWPEVAGMIIGQLVILAMLLIARRLNRVSEGAQG